MISSTTTTTTSTTTTKATTTKATTTKKTSPSTCVNGQFYPHPTDCKKFYLCDQGHFVEEFCTSGTVWDPTINQCNFDWAVDCCNGQRPCPIE